MTDSGGDPPRSDDDGASAGADDADESPPTPGADQPDRRSASVDRTRDDNARAPTGARDRPNAPPPRRVTEQEPPSPVEQPLGWYFASTDPLIVASRDILSSVLLVAMVGLALFAVSGVWPPLVAVESGSMEPNMHRGDLVIVVDEDRFASQLATEDGIVTAQHARGTDHRQFGKPGSVIVYRPDGDTGTPIIHRAVMYVEEDENWVARADPQHLGNVDECTDIPDQCPADYDGYITLGDANPQYDQVTGQSAVVKPSWIEGRAVARAPYLGCIRLALSEGGVCGG